MNSHHSRPPSSCLSTETANSYIIGIIFVFVKRRPGEKWCDGSERQVAKSGACHAKLREEWAVVRCHGGHVSVSMPAFLWGSKGGPGLGCVVLGEPGMWDRVRAVTCSQGRERRAAGRDAVEVR